MIAMTVSSSIRVNPFLVDLLVIMFWRMEMDELGCGLDFVIMGRNKRLFFGLNLNSCKLF